MPDWEESENERIVKEARRVRRALENAEIAAEDAALLDALNAMGNRGLRTRITFNTNDRDAVMSALHDAGFTVAREEYIEKPF